MYKQDKHTDSIIRRNPSPKWTKKISEERSRQSLRIPYLSKRRAMTKTPSLHSESAASLVHETLAQKAREERSTHRGKKKTTPLGNYFLTSGKNTCRVECLGGKSYRGPGFFIITLGPGYFPVLVGFPTRWIFGEYRRRNWFRPPVGTAYRRFYTLWTDGC